MGKTLVAFLAGSAASLFIEDTVGTRTLYDDVGVIR